MTDTLTDRQTHSQTDRRTHRQTDALTDRQTHSQTYRHPHTPKQKNTHEKLNAIYLIAYVVDMWGCGCVPGGTAQAAWRLMLSNSFFLLYFPYMLTNKYSEKEINLGDEEAKMYLLYTCINAFGLVFVELLWKIVTWSKPSCHIYLSYTLFQLAVLHSAPVSGNYIHILLSTQHIRGSGKHQVL